MMTKVNNLILSVFINRDSKYFFWFLSSLRVNLPAFYPGFSFEARGRTFGPVIFHSISGTLISIFEGLFIILLLL